MDAEETAELTIAETLAHMQQVLAAAGIDSSADGELLLAHVLKVTRGRVQALAVMGTTISEVDRSAALQLASERARRVPLQHLTGRAPFRTLELEVGPGVFVPRPETEITAGFAIDALRSVPDARPKALDLCTGSGAIALAVATEVPTAQVWAIEKSHEAHAWARRNVDRLGDGRVDLRLGDLADTLQLVPSLQGSVHVLVSNPPYVPDGMVPRDPEVRDHDPALALFGGPDGLDLVRVISQVGLDLVVPGGALVLEHAEVQGAAIRQLLAADGWRAAATHRDLTMRDRVTTAVR